RAPPAPGGASGHGTSPADHHSDQAAGRRSGGSRPISLHSAPRSDTGDFCISPRKGIFQRLHDCCFCGKRHPEVTIDTDLRETVVLHESLNENTLGTSTV